MNLEQLQLLSDAELNELSAVKVMGYSYRGYCEDAPAYPYVSPDPNGKLVMYDEEEFYKWWSPTSDMNDAMELANKFNTHQITKSHTGFSHSELPYRAIVGKNQNVAYSDSPSRAITIASILALE